VLDTETCEPRKKQRIDELCVALLEYNFLPVFRLGEKMFPKAAVKKDIFRFSTLLVLYLKNVLGIDTVFHGR